MLATLLVLAAGPSLTILFVGNSLLNGNDLPAMATDMLRSDGTGRAVSYAARFVGHLEDVPRGSAVDREVCSGKYDVVVLQGAMVSSSMRRTYAQTRGIEMATEARRHGSRVLLFVEWPRRGIAETEFTRNVYRGIAKASGTELLPVCDLWNSVSGQPGIGELWLPDGNHATVTGSFVGASAVFLRIAGAKAEPRRLPNGLDAKAQTILRLGREMPAILSPSRA